MDRAKLNACRVVFFVFSVFLFQCSTYAAEISSVGVRCFFQGKNCDEKGFAILINGNIEIGDYKKFSLILSQYDITPSVILRSQGGNVYESLKIGKIIRDLIIDTSGPDYDLARAEGSKEFPKCRELGIPRPIQPTCICASACFLIFAAGAPRNTSYVLLHRPFINPENNRQFDLDQSIKNEKLISGDVSKYLLEIEVNEVYSRLLFSIPSNESRYIRRNAMRDQIAGYPRAIEEWLMATCKTKTHAQRERELDDFPFTGTPEDNAKLELLVQQRDKDEECIYNSLAEKRDKALKDWKNEFNGLTGKP